ncbi:hypothetical protein ACFP2T_13465 [Plantactinospora solaniradicis]|uniref:Minor tail protein n=1 Tax=Plantactinospora solaniradicis TaxID=1723736 RepID=A0ABW1K5Z0_9ACTN
MAWPSSPLGVRVEIYLGPALGWVDITADVRLGRANSGGGITITRGRQNWGQDADFSTVDLTINNRTGKYTARNPRAEYYGIIGRNTPIRIRVNELAGSGWVNIPTGGQLTTPDVAALDITGDIDVRVDAALTGWVSGATLASKYSTATDERSWAFLVDTGGNLGLYWSPNGTFASRLYAESTAPVSVQPGARLAVRVTLDVNNGAAGNTTTFYTAPTLAGPWTQLGSPVVKVGTTSIHPGGDVVQVGREDGLTDPPACGRLYGLEIRNGINGTAVANPTFADQDPSAFTITDAAGRVWTLNEVNVVNPAYRIAGEVVAWPPRWDVSEKDKWVPLEATGILRRLGVGARPVLSPLHRYWQTRPILRFWPVEDTAGADQVSSGLPGGQAAVPSGGVNFAGDDTLPGATRVATLPEGAQIRFPGVTQVSGTAWSVLWYFKLPQVPTFTAPLVQIRSNGRVTRWEVSATSTEYLITGFDVDGNSVTSNNTGHGTAPTEWIAMQLTVIQDGANVDWYGYWQAVSDPETLYYTGDPPPTYAGSIGAPVEAMAEGDADSIDMAFGSLVIGEGNIPWSTNRRDAAGGHLGETAADRIRRVGADENGIPISIIGDPTHTAPMGRQRPGTLPEVLRDCARADGGILFEDRGRVGLVYRTRESLYNQSSLTLSYSTGHVSPPFEPVDDDQLTQNDITATRADGGSYRTVQETGPLNVQEPGTDPDAVGVYAATPTVNVAASSQLPDVAGWLKHLGTWAQGDRYASIHADLTHPSYTGDMAMTRAVAALDSGDVPQVDDLPDWVAPGPAPVMVQGATEVIDAYDWDITFNATPGGPWKVAVADGDQRAPADGSTLVADITDTDTELLLGSTIRNGPWRVGSSITLPDTFPLPMRLGGEIVTVSEIAPSVVDAYGRTSVSTWASPDVGPAYTTSGGAASDYNVSGGTGRHSNTDVGILRRSKLNIGSIDWDHTIDVSFPMTNANTAPVTAWCAGRLLDDANNYLAVLSLSTAGVMSLRIDKRVAGALTNVTAARNVASNSANNWWRVRFRGSGSTMWATAQNITTGSRSLSMAATDTSLTTGTQIGVMSRLETGNTNSLPVLIQWDNLTVHSPQLVTVTRGVNGFTRAWTAGTPIDVADPAIAAH